MRALAGFGQLILRESGARCTFQTCPQAFRGIRGDGGQRKACCGLHDGLWGIIGALPLHADPLGVLIQYPVHFVVQVIPPLPELLIGHIV